jgi:hypothetical protein
VPSHVSACERRPTGDRLRINVSFVSFVNFVVGNVLDVRGALI